MKKLLILGLFLAAGCAGGNYAEEKDGGFDASICKDIPIGVERLAAVDPESDAFKISCADLEQCTSIMGWDAPPDVPCTGP